MYNQLYPYFDNIFSRLQCGFRKGHNAQHCFMSTIKKLRDNTTQKNEVFH